MIKNLTPHNIDVLDENGNVVLTVPASGYIARVETERLVHSEVNGIKLYTTEWGQCHFVDSEGNKVAEEEVIDMGMHPETLYIVSYMFLKRAYSSRASYACECVSPGDLVRDRNGQPVGCKGLNVSP